MLKFGILILLLLFPIFWPFIAKLIWKQEITGTELLANIVVVSLCVAILFFISLAGRTWDTEVWNGEITSKTRQVVSCSHSYSCFCYTDSKGNQHCQTCYEHSYDVSWLITSNVGSTYINRVDRQGLVEPKRWTVSKIGDPFSATYSFTNYIKASPNSLFNEHSETLSKQFEKMMPEYPNYVYDYYKVDRVINVGTAVSNLKEWNDKLSVALKDLGPKKEANIIIVLVNTLNREYADALSYKWVGGKKNDIIVVISTTSYPKINWVKVIGWTDNVLYKIQLERKLSKIQNLNSNTVINMIHDHTMATYKRRNWDDFNYLRATIFPSNGMLWIIFFFGMISSIGMSIFFANNQEKEYTRW